MANQENNQNGKPEGADLDIDEDRARLISGVFGRRVTVTMQKQTRQGAAASPQIVGYECAICGGGFELNPYQVQGLDGQELVHRCEKRVAAHVIQEHENDISFLGQIISEAEIDESEIVK